MPRSNAKVHHGPSSLARVSRALTAAVFYLTLGTPYAVRAQESEPVEVELTDGASDEASESRNAWSEEPSDEPGDGPEAEETGDKSDEGEAAEPEGAPAEQERPLGQQASPASSSKSAVTPQAISLPNAEGSIEGMGESFTPNLSAGTGTFSVPISLPAGRAGVQPSLSLSYSTSGGNSCVGVGWSLGAPFISRQTDKGLPRYVRSSDGQWHEEEDVFMYNGGQELVPVDSAQATAIDGVAVPAELDDWQQYRARVEGAFMRFFRSPDELRWVVQDKKGTRFEFGQLAAGEGPSAVVADSSDSLVSEFGDGQGRIFSWGLTRMSDAHGSTVYYGYAVDEGQRYLSDIHYVSPATCAGPDPEAQRNCSEPLSSYGRRVHMVYEDRDDAFDSYISTWRINTGLRLRRIEVTSAQADAEGRHLVRRYHLRYDPSSYLSLLQEVQVEGRPHSASPRGTGVLVGDRLVPEASLDDEIVGSMLPPMNFHYSAPAATTASVDGFPGIDATVHASASSPPHSSDEARSDLFDVNSDGLPDLIVTDPARYRTAEDEPAVGVFFNGFVGPDAAPGTAGEFSDAVPVPMPPDYSDVMHLANLNVAPMDIDGDGRSDLLHMPRVAEYSYFMPTRAPAGDIEEVSPALQGWRFTRIPVELPRGEQDPRIDFGRDGTFFKVADVDNDHLIDVVRTSGTVMQTWLNLGRYPGGDGLFGTASWTGAEWELSTEPIESCLLQEGLPVDFEDAEVRLADMNGDGIQDIVKIRLGRVVYWPGRGAGLWGTGAPTCDRGEGDGREIEMLDPPQEFNAELDGVFLSDVNHDGAADVVQVRFDALDVWFNKSGRAFTARTTAEGTPYAPAFAPAVRFADIDGSGTTDVVYAHGDDWQWVDLMGGQRPRLLEYVENGLGGVTELGYGSSTEDYLRDLAEAASCNDSSCARFTWNGMLGACDQKVEAATGDCVHRSGGSPVVSTVVRTLTTRDQFDQLGRDEFIKLVEYAYHDGFYEGIEQEFRGFGAGDVISHGETGNPTSITRTHFHQGRRQAEIASDRLADNPEESLKGRPFFKENFDETGAYHSASYSGFTLREIHRGLNGRSVTYAFVHRTDAIQYDNAPFVASAGSVLADPLNADSTEFVTVQYQLAGPGLTSHTDAIGLPPRLSNIPVRGATFSHIGNTVDTVDNAGNVRQQTAHGRLRGEFDQALPDESITVHSIPGALNAAAGTYHWVPAEAYVTGHGDEGQQLGHAINTHSSTGDLLVTLQPLTRGASVPAYEFAGDGSGAAGYSEPDQDLVSSTNYDTWGNPLGSCSGADMGPDGQSLVGCLRFNQIEYEGRYNQFPRYESVAVAGVAPDFELLVTEATWDWGLYTPLSVFDPNRLETRIEHDGFGRLVSMTPPNVYACADADVPLTRIAYELAASGQPVSVVTTTTEQSCAAVGADPLTSKSYIDGIGRVRATAIEAEDANDPHVATRTQRAGIATFYAKGGTRSEYQQDVLAMSLADLSPAQAVAVPLDIPSTTTVYDAFDRVSATLAEDGAPTRYFYHAQSQDIWDPLDLDRGSPHYGTPATERRDGHGRIIDSILRNVQSPGMGIETYRLFTDYRADNQVVQLERAETLDDAHRAAAAVVAGRSVIRHFHHDNQGRRLGSNDPDTDDPNGSPGTRTWRYLFNRVDDLVAVRDPRGCGQNFFYDRAGRLIGEDYVQCSEAQDSGEQRPSSVPSGSIAYEEISGSTPVDARYYFDAYPDWFEAAEGFDMVPTGANRTLGRATASVDRAQRSVAAYDSRGGVIWQARQMAVIPNAQHIDLSYTGESPPVYDDDAIADRPIVYDPETYVLEHSYDHAGRVRSLRMPTDPDYSGTAPLIGGLMEFNVRNLPSRAALTIDGVQYPIADRIEYTRDGLPSSVIYGDTAGGSRAATESRTIYDLRRRPERSFVIREPTELADADPVAGRPLGAVTVVADQQIHWDAANNLTAIDDLRDGNEWPIGFRPASHSASHDALYRVTGVEYDYTHDDGSRLPDDTFVDYRSELEQVELEDPMRTDPAPLLPLPASGRVNSLTYEYDWLANMVDWGDDAQQFYERSIGRITNGVNEPGDRPAALRLASDLPTTAGIYNPVLDRGGWLEVDYGVGGNVERLTAHAQCTDSGGLFCYDDPSADLETRRQQLRDHCDCAAEQHYQYRWDELNRLVDARRFDRFGDGDDWDLEARQRYRYDAANQRTVKHVMSITGDVSGEVQPTTSNERIALYVYPDEYERRGLSRDDVGEISYEANAVWETETQYLVGGARVVIKNGDAPLVGVLDRDVRVTVALTDVIRSTSAVIDLMSGALVECSTYYPNGARESYRAPDGPGDAIAAEPDGFSGKEADEEVGLIYFGERYLIPHIGRWASPDPLWVHSAGGGEVGNAFHYVGGNLLQARDPLGLDPTNWVHTFDTEQDFQEWQAGGGSCANEAMCVAGVGSPDTGFTVYEWSKSAGAFAKSDALTAKWNQDPSSYHAARTGKAYLTLNTAAAAIGGVSLLISAGVVSGTTAAAGKLSSLYTTAGQWVASRFPLIAEFATSGLTGLLEEYAGLGVYTGLGIAAGSAVRSAGGFDDIPVMAASTVKQALTAAEAIKDTTWAYSIHMHHIFPKWLGGSEDGPLLAIRGYEHIKDLEPKLFAHIKEAIPAIEEKTASHVNALVRSGRVTVDEITDALQDFYQSRYEGLDADAIRSTLEQALD